MLGLNHEAGATTPDPPQGFPIYSKRCNDDTGADSPWARKVILSLDGGGVKGYSSLLILERLLKDIIEIERRQLPDHGCSAAYPWSPEGLNTTCDDFFIHHYVDYFFGTSTGGLSAIMLGRLKSSVADAKRNYDLVGERVFKRPRELRRGNLKAPIKSRLKTRYMEQVLKELTAAPQEGDDVKTEEWASWAADDVLMRDPNERSSRTVVVAYCEETRLFRSYDKPRPSPMLNGHEQGLHINPGPASALPLWQIGRATSAAPGWFDPMWIGQLPYEDGALSKNNNPVKLAYQEVKQMHPEHEPSIIVSIGTGAKPRKNGRRWRKKERFMGTKLKLDKIRKLKDELSRSEDIHVEFRDAHEFQQFEDREEDPDKAQYFRFDVPSRNPIRDVKLGDWKGLNGNITKKAIQGPTEDYLKDPKVVKELRRCAQKLVDIKRRREVTARWEAFALDGQYYCCPENDCKKVHFRCRRELRQHAIEKHGYARQVRCRHHDDVGNLKTQINWTCFWDHCEEEASAFDEKPDFIEHLRSKHQFPQADVKDYEAFEAWLDRGRNKYSSSTDATLRRQRTGRTESDFTN